MTYRETKRSAETMARMRAGREAARMARPAPEYPIALPDLRRRVIVIDYDFGERVHTLDLFRTRRVELPALPWLAPHPPLAPQPAGCQRRHEARRSRRARKHSYATNRRLKWKR